MENKEKEVINESIKVADVLAKQLKIWQRVSFVLFGILVMFGILSYIYFYNTETVVETTTLEGVNALYNNNDGTNNYNHQLIASDYITNENILKLMTELNKTNNITNK